MMISTKGRYVLRVMTDLASQDSGAYIPMKDVAARQDLSLKYIEKLMPVLTRHNLVEGVHGKGGGYRLVRAPEDYSLGEILRLTEGSLAPVSCLEENAAPCPRAAYCATLPVWTKLDGMINSYLDSVTLRDLLPNQTGNDYVI